MEFFALFVGLAGLWIGAQATIRGAIAVAQHLGVSEFVVGIAVLKQQAELSLGNLIGSNVFDTLMPVGVAAPIARLEFDADLLRYELPFLFLLTSVVLIFLIRRLGLQRREAIVIIAMYGTYVVVKVQEVVL